MILKTPLPCGVKNYKPPLPLNPKKYCWIWILVYSHVRLIIIMPRLKCIAKLFLSIKYKCNIYFYDSPEGIYDSRSRLGLQLWCSLFGGDQESLTLVAPVSHSSFPWENNGTWFLFRNIKSLEDWSPVH